MLAAVSDQFAEINKSLDTQLTRMAQLQDQIDRQRKDAMETRADVARIRTIIEKLTGTRA